MWLAQTLSCWCQGSSRCVWGPIPEAHLPMACLVTFPPPPKGGPAGLTLPLDPSQDVLYEFRLVAMAGSQISRPSNTANVSTSGETLRVPWVGAPELSHCNTDLLILCPAQAWRCTHHAPSCLASCLSQCWPVCWVGSFSWWLPSL